MCASIMQINHSFVTIYENELLRRKFAQNYFSTMPPPGYSEYFLLAQWQSPDLWSLKNVSMQMTRNAIMHLIYDHLFGKSNDHNIRKILSSTHVHNHTLRQSTNRDSANIFKLLVLSIYIPSKRESIFNFDLL